MVGDGRPADSTKVDRIVLVELLHAVFGHVPATFQVRFAAPVEGCPFEGETAVGFGEGVKDLGGSVGNVNSDAVAGNGWIGWLVKWRRKKGVIVFGRSCIV